MFCKTNVLPKNEPHLKRYPERESYAILSPSFQIFCVCETANIVDAEKAEDVFDASGKLHIRQLAHHAATVGKHIEPGSIRTGDVFLRKTAVNTTEREHLTKLKTVP